jgi:signal transduction histidine kinase
VFDALSARLSGVLLVATATISIIVVISSVSTGPSIDLDDALPRSSNSFASEQKDQAHITTAKPVPEDLHGTAIRRTELAQWPLVRVVVLLFAQLAALLTLVWLAVRRVLETSSRDISVESKQGSPHRYIVRSGENPTDLSLPATTHQSEDTSAAALFSQEKAEMLAAISHDLHTPVTRLRLRIDTLIEGELRDRLLHDVTEIQKLIEQGILYARAAKTIEANMPIDLTAFASDIALSYQFNGAEVTAGQTPSLIIFSKRAALTTVISNLVDNALKFAGSAEIVAIRDANGRPTIQVLDRGPGVPNGQLESVLRPFYRLEMSRNRDTGGSGLGLAIANELTRTIGARLSLRNRETGGLVAELAFQK